MAVEIYNHPLYSDANLVSYYRLEGNSDDSKSSNNLTASNISYGISYGKYGQGALFNGSTSKLLSSASIIAGNSNRTVMLWYYPTSNASLQFIYTKMLDQANPGLFLANNSGTLRLVYRAASDTGFNAGPLTLNTWQHIAITQTSGGTVEIYQNGVDTGGGTVTMFANTNKECFGRSDTDGAFGLSGNLDDIAMFNRTLSATEILDYYNFVANKNQMFLSF